MELPVEQLIELARKHKITRQEQEAQIRSFAYGNIRLHNDQITREEIDKAAASLNLWQ